jgi:hypothetical protein
MTSKDKFKKQTTYPVFAAATQNITTTCVSIKAEEGRSLKSNDTI